jgi:hypothetical protein
MNAQDIKPGDRVLVPAVVESLGHDDDHIIVRVGGVPVQVAVGTATSQERKHEAAPPG